MSDMSSKTKRKIMEVHANALEKFLENIKDGYMIQGMSDEEFKHHCKVVKKTIKRLRKGDDDVYRDPDNIDPDGMHDLY